MNAILRSLSANYGSVPICTDKHRLSRSQLCCFYRLFIAVDAMQRDVYATPSSGDGAGICSSFAFKAIHSKTALFLDQGFCRIFKLKFKTF